MKHFNLLLSFLLIISIVPAIAQQQPYTIKGSIDTSLKISTIYFGQGSFVSNQAPQIKKVPVQNGQFIITGNIPEPSPGFLSLAENLKPKDPSEFKQFVLDKGNISIVVKGKLATAAISGSKANDEVVKYTAGQSPYMAKLSALNEAAERQSQMGVPLDTIIKMYSPSLKEAGKELIAYQMNYIEKNPSAFISALMLPEVTRTTNNFFEAEASFNKLDATVRLSPTGKAIIDYITKEKKTSVGAFAPEFAAADTAGKVVALSSLKGKYILLDFWAAWCGPCRQENPNVVRAFQKYKDKGFTVLGVSLDRDRKDWLKGLRDDKLTWTHVSELKHFQSPTAVLYGINSIPRNFLLDPTGKIIARDLRGPDLIEKLEEVFREQTTRNKE
ncbi:TlpA disulfide reductase family protein [Daejeonella lutea]|uniref:Peroxiredoxin n=1 Tax=Daejeonella lutea TaxID=572036 RepID=A0A1T5D253_9SPHI|nr:TlpA disulfide reductase family protein [Daejeonella lutea]SKB65795.1 Peroxiredoxin [Daejeonella lutea]